MKISVTCPIKAIENSGCDVNFTSFPLPVFLTNKISVTCPIKAFGKSDHVVARQTTILV